jgi:thioredoxin-like negative regulator of GroEL
MRFTFLAVAIGALLLAPAGVLGQFGAPAGPAIPAEPPAAPTGPDRPLSLMGRLFINGAPVRDTVIEVRLETEGGVLLATAYTLASEEFQFRGVTVDMNDDHVLVVREPGFEELRHTLYLGREFLGAGMGAPGLRPPDVFLYLESADPSGGFGGPATVDAGRLINPVPDAAVEFYEAAIEDNRTGNVEAAVENLKQAIEIAPEFFEALNLLGSAYIEAGRYSEAQVLLTRAYDITDSDPTSLLNLGVLYFRQGQAVEAAAAEGPEDLLAGAHASYIEAIDYLEEALRLDPASPRIAFYLGSALYKAGSYDRAEELLVESMRRDSESDDARLTLINIYVRQQRHPEALEQVEVYLDANPDTPQRADLERARGLFRALLGITP